MPIAKDLTGKTFGRLTVEAFAGSRLVGTQVKRLWRCRCACGMEHTVTAGALTTGSTRSCGCLLREAITKHGGYRSAVYKIWHAMLERCRNSRHPSFKDYGGRGIAICTRWNEFAAFRTDMGPRPISGTLERRDVNGNYEPQNCHWASPLEQANNRRNNRTLTYSGQTKTMAQWARELGFSKSCIPYRLSAGWSVRRALREPSDRSLSNVQSRRLLQVK